MGSSTGPDFIIIGAQRCGTTSLRAYLSAHPDVIKPISNEIHYFDVHYAKGSRWYEHMLGRQQLSKLRFDKTPEYLVSSKAPYRIQAYCPDAKLIVMLRNPVDRIISQYRLVKRLGIEKRPFASAYTGTPRTKIFWYSYLGRGHYAEQLAHWFKLFPREQFHFVHSEHFYQNTDADYQNILKFVGLKAHHPPYQAYGGAPSNLKISDELVNKLRAYYRPLNEQLYKLLGYDFDW